MKSVVLKALQCVVAGVVSLSLVAGAGAEDAAKEKGKKRPERQQPSITMTMVKGIEITDEQKEKLAAIDKEFAGKLEELQKQQGSILTEDQLAAQREAGRKAKEAGQKPGEARKEIEEVLSLTDEQKAKLAELKKARGEVQQQIMARVMDVLTDDQEAALKKLRGEARRKPEGDAAKKPEAKGKGKGKPEGEAGAEKGKKTEEKTEKE